MESLNNGENLQQKKDEFKKWLKKYHENLSNKNQTLKSCLNTKQQRNKALKIKIENLNNNSLKPSTAITDVIPNKVQSQLDESVTYLKTKSELLKKWEETINDKVDEESKRLRKKLYEIITKDEVKLKPYHEVEQAIEELKHKTESCRKRLDDDKVIFFEKMKERQQKFTETKRDIIMLKPIQQEIRLKIENSNTNLEIKLKELKLKSIKEACIESFESKELLKDIENLKLQLKKKLQT